MFQNFKFRTNQKGSVHHKTLFIQIEHRELEQIKKKPAKDIIVIHLW